MLEKNHRLGFMIKMNAAITSRKKNQKRNANDNRLVIDLESSLDDVVSKIINNFC